MILAVMLYQLRYVTIVMSKISIKMDKEELQDICKKCPNYNTCTKLCPFAKRYIKDQTKFGIYEENHDTTITIYNGRNIYLYDFPGELQNVNNETYKEFFDEVDEIYISENTNIFADLFFAKRPLEDVCTRYGKRKDAVIETYQEKMRKLKNLLVELEEYKIQRRGQHKTISALKNTGKLTKGCMYFLMYHALGMTPKEIGDYYGLSAQPIRTTINKYTNRIRQGEPIFEFEKGTLEEVDRKKTNVDEVIKNALQAENKNQRQKIIAAIADGNHGQKDIEDATGLTYTQVRRSVAELKKLGVVASKKRNHNILTAEVAVEQISR